MILGTLHRRLFARYLAPEPGDTSGTSTGAPPAATASTETGSTTTYGDPAAAGTPGAPAAPAAPVDPFASLNDILDKVGKDESAAGTTPSPVPKPDAAAGTPPPVKKTPDAADDDLTPPEGLNERAQQRFTALADKVKTIPDIERRATEAETQLVQVRTMVNASGLSADEFTDMLETGRLFKSGDAKDLQQAMARLDALRTDIATRLGVDAPGADPLAAHADLQAEVDAMTLTKERALEIARLRSKGAQADNVTADQRELQQHQQAVQKGTVAMETALKQRASLPGHDAKVKAIGTYFADPAKKQAFVNTYAPHQWAAALTMMYDTMAVPAAAPAPAGPQPLRPGNTRAGAAMPNGPITAETAVMGAFDRLGL